MMAKHIEEEWEDSDGYWIALTPGWCSGFDPQCHTIHEDTKTEAHAIPVERCLCSECVT